MPTGWARACVEWISATGAEGRQRIGIRYAAVRHRRSAIRWLGVAGAVCAVLFGAPSARAATIAYTFDPPAFTAGQTVTTLPGVSFPEAPVVFDAVAAGFPGTASPPNALRHPVPCGTPCSPGSHMLTMHFDELANAVSMRVGAEVSLDCIPEQGCPINARLRGYADDNTLVADSFDVEVNQGLGSSSPITTPVQITDSLARIRTATLVVVDPNAVFNSRATLDDLVITTGPPVPTEPPAITLTSPANASTVGYPYTTRLAGSVSAPAGLLAFCTGANLPAPPPMAACTQGTLVGAGGAFERTFYNADLRPGENTLDAYAYDSQGRLGQAHATITLSEPPKPRIALSKPAPGTQFRTPADVFVAGSAEAAGIAAGFCLRVNDDTRPAAADCTDLATLGRGIGEPARYNFAAFVDPTRLLPGANRIHAWIFDRWGRSATASVDDIVLPVDARITGIDVMQSVQAGSPHLRVDGTRQNYHGSTLYWGKPTFVRVYANVPVGSARNIDALLTLGGEIVGRQGERPLGIFPPVSKHEAYRWLDPHPQQEQLRPVAPAASRPR